MSNTTLETAVNHWAAEPDSDDPVLETVAKHGTYDTTPLTRHEVPGTTNQTFYHGPGLSEPLIKSVEAFVREYQPQMKECFANTVELWRYDNQFTVVEGVTAGDADGPASVHDHAWNHVDGVVVDVTRSSAERYGVELPGALLQDAVPVMEDTNIWTVLQHEDIETSF